MPDRPSMSGCFVPFAAMLAATRASTRPPRLRPRRRRPRGDGPPCPSAVEKMRLRQRARGHPPRGPPHAHRRRRTSGTTSARRTRRPGKQRLRAPLRARDVPGQQARAGGHVLPLPRARRRHRTSTARPAPTARTTSRPCPTNRLELALWLESDRMGFLLDHVDEQTFAGQRDVVKNERRQNYENAPYGLVGAVHRARRSTRRTHPYHHLTIGSPEDLDAATLDDVRAVLPHLVRAEQRDARRRRRHRPGERRARSSRSTSGRSRAGSAAGARPAPPPVDARGRDAARRSRPASSCRASYVDVADARVLRAGRRRARSRRARARRRARRAASTSASSTTTRSRRTSRPTRRRAARRRSSRSSPPRSPGTRRGAAQGDRRGARASCAGGGIDRRRARARARPSFLVERGSSSSSAARRARTASTRTPTTWATRATCPKDIARYENATTDAASATPRARWLPPKAASSPS